MGLFLLGLGRLRIARLQNSFFGPAFTPFLFDSRLLIILLSVISLLPGVPVREVLRLFLWISLVWYG